MLDLDDLKDMEDLEREEMEAASLEVFSQVVIGRNQVERWFGEPYWNDVIRVRPSPPTFPLYLFFHPHLHLTSLLSL